MIRLNTKERRHVDKTLTIQVHGEYKPIEVHTRVAHSLGSRQLHLLNGT
jgi:hypothetical protein